MLCAEQRPAGGGSLPAVMLSFGVLKFARSKMLNSCAMNSARCDQPMRKNFEKPQVDVREARAIDRRHLASGRAPARNAFTASRFMLAAAGARHARPPADRRCSRRRSDRASWSARTAGSSGSRRSPRAAPRAGSCDDAAGDEAMAAIGRAVARRSRRSRSGRRACSWPGVVLRLAQRVRDAGTDSDATSASRPSAAARGRCCPPSSCQKLTRRELRIRASPWSPDPAGSDRPCRDRNSGW